MNEKETDMFEELFINPGKSGGDFFIPSTNPFYGGTHAFFERNSRPHHHRF